MAKAIWVVIAIFGSISIILGGLYYAGLFSPNNPLEADAYYTETVTIGITFPEITNFTVYLPAITANGSITPALQGVENEQIEYSTINDSSYLKISGNQQQFNWSNTVDLPAIRDDRIAYERFLFDHSYSGLDSQQNINENSSLIFILEANNNASLVYSLEARTNLCGIESSSIANSEDVLILHPGKTKINQLQILFQGWCT